MLQLGDEAIRKPALRPAAIRGFLLLVVVAPTAMLLSACATPAKPERQAMVHEMGQQVMPFDLAKTQHIFDMTESGGIQQVIVRNPADIDQIPLIRQHLQHESTRFMMGDFSDPTSLHGVDMPGVKDLSENAAKVKVEYSDLPNGGQITFTTEDLHLVTSIHRWFGAQLSDHGADATYR